MTTQTQNTTTAQEPAIWQKLMAWFRDLDDALNFDPQEYTDDIIRSLQGEVKQLNTRLDEVEGRN